MYKITVEGRTVATSDFTKYSASSGTLSQEINAASILEFTLPPTNPQLDAFALRRRPVRLLSDNTVLFEGDVVERTTSFDGSVTVKCQDALGWLNDVVVPKPTFSGTVSAYWEWLIAKYNDNASSRRQVKAGNVTVTGDVSVLYEKEFPTIFELVRSLVTLRGGYVSVRYYAGDIYLDYTVDLGVQSEQDIRYGVNLLNLEDYFSGEDAFSRLYPRGKNGLDISSVNGGVPYLYDAQRAITNGYGIIGKCVDFDTDDAATLKALGEAYLASYGFMGRTLSVTALDLSIVDNSRYDSVPIGAAVRVKSPPHGIDLTLQVSAKTLDFVNPANSSFELGAQQKLLSAIVSDRGGRT